jgi:hypothetical protein
MHHAAARDVPGVRARLRETVQDFVNQVMALARYGGNEEARGGGTQKTIRCAQFRLKKILVVTVRLSLI